LRLNVAMSRSVPCPTCGSLAVYGPCNPWRPFCSRRCRSIDLGAWASEEFRVSAENTAADPHDRPGEGASFSHAADGTPEPRH
jgi:endogenous inhibitor of DNA gyrase (YacG/DUF329 family)